MSGLPVLNMTNFFNKDLFLYSLGDIKLSKPVSLKKVGFFLVGLIIWSFPIFSIFGLILDPIYLAFLFSVPILLGIIGDKPLFDGRNIFDATAIVVKFVFSDKCYTDTVASDTHLSPTFFIEQEIWISRRQELQELANMIEVK